MFHFIPNNTEIYKQLVSVNGFYATGSSAVIDVFRECQDTTVLFADLEPETNTRTYDGCGEIGYYYLLNLLKLKTSFFNDDDSGFNGTFLEFLRDYYHIYKNRVNLYQQGNFASSPFFKKCVDEFLISILDLTEADITFIKNEHDFFFPMHSYQHWVEIAQQLPYEIPNKVRYANLSFNKQYYCFYQRKNISSQAFDAAVKTMNTRLFQAVPSKSFMILDQFLAYCPYYKHKNLVPKLKQISVIRDIRDSYFIVMCEAGEKRFISVSDYIEHMKKYDIFNEYNVLSDNLIIWLEDLIYHYDATIAKIFDFVGLDPKLHSEKFKFFDPKRSIKSLQLYKLHHDQKLMQTLAELFPQMCYSRT